MKLRVVRERNNSQFDRTHQLQPKKIEEDNSVLVYDTNLNNQHKATRKLARTWLGPYVVTSANDNGTYHLAELGQMQLAVPVDGMQIKAFRKQHEEEVELGSVGDANDQFEVGDDSKSDG